MSRPYTVEEMRKMFLDHLHTLTDYWITTPLTLGEDTVRRRMEGLVFSILVMFDGCSGGMPAMDIAPAPHPSDEDYHRDNGENWWTDATINDCHLHDMWYRKDE